MSLISSFYAISVVIRYPNIFSWFPALSADVAGVNPNGTNTLVVDSVCRFFINGRPTFMNGPRSLPRNPPDCIILDSGLFDNSLAVNELFVKPCKNWRLVY